MITVTLPQTSILSENLLIFYNNQQQIHYTKPLQDLFAPRLHTTQYLGYLYPPVSSSVLTQPLIERCLGLQKSTKTSASYKVCWHTLYSLYPSGLRCAPHTEMWSIIETEQARIQRLMYRHPSLLYQQCTVVIFPSGPRVMLCICLHRLNLVYFLQAYFFLNQLGQKLSTN